MSSLRFWRMAAQFAAWLTCCCVATLVAVTPAAAQALKEVKFSTEFAPHGFHAPFYLAREKGWFKDAGIDLKLIDGRGSSATINLIGANQVDIAFVNLAATIIAQSKGVPVVAVGSILRRNTQGLILKKGSNIHKPADLKGKTILHLVSTIEAQLLGGYLATAGMSLSDVKLLGVDASAKVASVLSGRGDAATGPVPYYLGLLKGKSEIDTLAFADAGQQLLDFGIVTSPKMIKEQPALVAAFMQVVSRAFEYTRKGNNVEEAVKAMIAQRPEAGLDYQTSINMFNSHIAFAMSPSTEGKPLGYISKEDVEASIKTLKDTGIIQGDIKADSVFDPKFGPK
ncbi:MAG: ABC transporter substrate-binding protein [Proteobacteria bacterium]|nr:ABC transporter substrate-binding protein [Pseudomonadota bacterium]